MNILSFKKDISFKTESENRIYKAGHEYFFPDKWLFVIKERLKKENIKSNLIFSETPINKVYPEIKEENKSKVFIFRQGGIGDLIALSSVAHYLQNKNITFICSSRYFEVFKWFKTEVKYKDIKEPVGRSLNASFINYEGRIEESKENWFKEFFYFNPSYYNSIKNHRPELKTERIYNDPSFIDTSKPNILLCPRSSSFIRNIPFIDMYKPLSDLLKGKDINIYVHKQNLSLSCSADIEDIKDERIKIIPQRTLKEFLLDCYDAEYTISVDTGLFHFREGIKKPALGIYNAFPGSSRVSTYSYTKFVDVKSECNLSPCFQHTTETVKFCKNNIGVGHAACLSQCKNSNLYNQLKQAYAKAYFH